MAITQHEIHAQDNLRIDYFRDDARHNTYLAFVFSAFGNRELAGNPYGGDYLCRNGFDVISFKNIDNDWFQSVPSAVFATIEAQISGRNYVKRFAYGSSMGGYASIAFSKRLRIDKALAISPQITIRDDFDRRWAKRARSIRWVYEIDGASVARDCQFFVLYDPDNIDQQHIDRLSTLLKDKLRPLRIRFAGHNVALMLRQAEELKDVVLDVLTKDDVAPKVRVRNRRQSLVYLSQLFAHLLARKKYRTALSVIDMAIALKPDEGRYLRDRSLALEKLGRTNEAIAAAKAYCASRKFKKRVSSTMLFHALRPISIAQALRALRR